MASELSFGCAEAGDIPEITAFLRGVFQAESDAIIFRDDVMRWKALAPHPLWDGGRSYVVRAEGRIVAHGCAMPCRFLHPEGEVNAACIIDWAAGKAFPGTGMLIFREVGSFVQGIIGVGGSEDTQKLLPRMMFKTGPTFFVHERVLSPFAWFQASSARDWRAFARLGRNILRRVRMGTTPTPGWTAERLDRFDERVLPVLPTPGLVAKVACYRGVELLNYFLSCPAAEMSAVLVRNQQKLVGYAVLAKEGPNVRIGELWVNSSNKAEWSAALNAVATLAESKTTGRIEIGCSTGLGKQAAEAAGFALCGLQPIYLKTKSNLLSPFDVSASLLETDSFYF